jgi:hypothetical protein
MNKSRALLVYLTLVSHLCGFNQIARAEKEVSNGINTIDEPDSGNWYEKLQWWKKAEHKYKEVRQGVNYIKAQEKELVHKKTTATNDIQQFFSSLKINPKMIQAMIEKVIEGLKAQQEATADEFDEQQRAVLVENADKQKELEQLKQYFDTFFSLVSKLDQAISSRVFEQRSMAEVYEEKALDSFEQIENVLDDQKARYYYETIENSSDNIKSIVDYLKGPLNNYIDQIIIRLQQLKQSIKQAVEDLEKRDISLKYLTAEEQAQQELAKKKQLEAEQDRVRKAQAQRKSQGQQVRVSWWQSLWSSITGFFASIYKALFGPKS